MRKWRECGSSDRALVREFCPDLLAAGCDRRGKGEGRVQGWGAESPSAEVGESETEGHRGEGGVSWVQLVSESNSPPREAGYCVFVELSGSDHGG